MYEFEKRLKRLKRTKENSVLSGLSGYANNEHISFNQFKLSIQCSAYHYCDPRQLNEDPTLYDAYEVAVLYGNDLIETRYHNDDSVIGYMTKEQVNELYNYVQELDELVVEIDSANKAILYMKHDEEIIRHHCKNILKRKEI